MKNDFDPNLPIYIQVMEEIKKEIFAVSIYREVSLLQ